MYFSGIGEWELKKGDKTQLLLSHIDRGTKVANTVTVEINSLDSKNLRLHTEKDGGFA
ncbi:MAG: hypothetical protein ACI9XP_000659 [Lentimonas sp.]|jgi:hypothetical protein